MKSRNILRGSVSRLRGSGYSTKKSQQKFAANETGNLTEIATYAVKPLLAIVMTMLSILMLTITPASANASSGWVYGTTHASVTYCNEATISTGRYSAGYIESNSGSSCGSDYSSPSGYMGILVNEFFNGTICGQFGYTVNDVAKNSFGEGGYWCGDMGTGVYNSSVDNEYWNSSAGTYYSAGSATSPGQSYNIVTQDGATTSTASGVTEGPVPASDFNGGPLSLTSLPTYITVTSGGTTVGYVASTSIVQAPGTPMANPLSPTPVYNQSLQQIVGHLVSGQGFVPLPGSNLPATFASGTMATATLLP